MKDSWLPIHRLNNIAQKDVERALQDTDYKDISRSAMCKAQDLFKKQKKSPLAADHIKAKCGGKVFVIPNQTRWNRKAFKMSTI